jgi:dTDP-4-amino-4,6-dideoxygalactose transaminase
MSPSIDHFIPFARPSLGRDEEDAVVSVLRTGWLTTGRETLQFEKEFAEFVGAPYALAVNSATAGLHLALEALRLAPGELVVTTPYTFTSTAEVIRYRGGHPLFVDIEEDTLNMDPDLVERAVKERAEKQEQTVRAIIPVHVGGLPCDMGRLRAVAGDEASVGTAGAAPSRGAAGTAAPGENSGHGRIALVEDAAHAFPVKTEAGYAGTLGDIGVFSFYATKPLATGEGGMIVTRDEHLAKRISIMRLHGIDREVWNRYQAKGHTSWKYDVIDAGYKYNMTDMAAAIGRVQLSKSQRFLTRRRQIAERYRTGFAGADFLQLPAYTQQHAWHLFILTIVPERLSIDRDAFIHKLSEFGIGTSVHYIPLHIMSYYRRQYGFKPEDFPVALRTYQTCFSLPIYPDLTDEEVEYIIATVLEVGEQARRRVYR